MLTFKGTAERRLRLTGSDSVQERSYTTWSQQQSGARLISTNTQQSPRMLATRNVLRTHFNVPFEFDDDEESMTSTATEAVPPLTRGQSTRSSNSSAQTDLASDINGAYLLESHDGVLTVPNRYRRDANLLCPFQILDCDQTFSDLPSFKSHVFTHFRGQALPKFASCFLCDLKFAQGPEEDGVALWNNMLSHMAHEHFRQGQRLATVRTDFTLMRWMYNRRLISEHQFKRTQLCPTPIIVGTASGSSVVVNAPVVPMPPPALLPASFPVSTGPSVGLQSESYTIIAGRRAERRRRDATRMMVSPLGVL